MFKCTKIINQSHIRRNQINFNMNKCHLRIATYMYYSIKSEYSRNILAYFDFKRFERRSGVENDSSSESISCLSFFELELDVFEFNNCISLNLYPPSYFHYFVFLHYVV